MSFCSSCGRPVAATDKFCKGCGAAVAAKEPAAPVEPATPVTPVAPVAPAAPVTYVTKTYSAPVCSTKAKVLGFVGMGLAIGGLSLAIIGILYTFIGLAVDEALAFGYSFGFSIFSFPLSIVGGILCSNSMDQGNRSAAPSVGSKLRIAGIVVSAVMLFIGFICLMSM